MRTLVAGALLASLALTSCTSDKESAADVASRLAEGLATGTLPDVFAGTAPQSSYDEVVAGLGEEAERQVEVESVTEDDGTAEATLAWEWQLEGSTWRYSTSATLEEGERWRVVWDPALVEPSLEEGETLEVSTVAARRGEILAGDGRAIVTERPVVRYGVDKTKVPARLAAESARRVASLLDVTPRPFVQAVKAAGDKAFVEAIVLRPEDARDVDPSFGDVRGAVALEDDLPLAPTREFAAPILGRVGPVTAELIEESDGRLEVGDQAGLSGLQARYDEQLTGTDGIRVEAVAEDGTSRTVFSDGPVDGSALRTTLDIDLQSKAERVLSAQQPVSAIVAIRPSTGELLVAANGPGNDGLNAATFGQYAPGSTFKVVSSLALLRDGMTPESQVDCPASIVVDGRRFENYDDYPPDRLGAITLADAVAYSCNTAFLGQADRLGRGDVATAAESLGVGQDYDLGFPAYFGQVPPPGSETEAAADLIGQGKVLASPMAMAAVAASVSAGRTVVPHLLEEVAPGASPSTPLTGAEARALRSLMAGVVSRGSGAFLADVGVTGAKTGTAEYGEPGPSGLPTHAWMIATRDDLAVAVFVATGESGSATAGPLLEAFLR
ncbi:MAG TPA: penicillin-binding transpeptidase domain-containing protein [Marmoricola sp.]|nr:penicillin-binding transpeptidase domain-containing protein [Marmoricola sp.]